MTSHPTEKKLINKIRGDDFLSFEIVFKKYYRNLCIFSEHYVGEPEMAKEIVGDFFLFYWENRKNIHITTSLNSYLYKSIYNRSIKYLNHLKVLKKYKDYAENRLKNASLLDSLSKEYPLSKLISQEAVNEIEHSIDSLPEKCKEIFILSRFENLNYEEIAKRLNISINTVRTQMSRALEKLRVSLAEYLPLLIINLIYYLSSLFDGF